MLKILTKEEYKEAINEFKDEYYHVTQSSDWEDIQVVNFPLQTRILYSNKDNKPLIIGRVVKSRILKFFTVLQLNFGPIINLNEITQSEFDEFLDEINIYFSTPKVLKTSQNVFLQLSPVSLSNDKNKKLENLLVNSKHLVISQALLRKLNSTIYVDLNGNIETILSSFRKDVRYNLKKLQEQDSVTVDISDKQTESKYFKEFWENFTKSVETKHFEDPGIKLYQKILEKGLGRIMLLKLSDETLSGAFLYEFKEQNSVIILSSFNTEKGLEYKSPTYLRFEIIKWAKENGYKTVDFYDGGSTKGIREFKLGFSNNLVEYPNCYDLVINKPLYNLALKRVFKY